MAAIKIERLEMKYGQFEALRSVDLEVPAGQFVTLLGPSGSGKTTALRCLAGLETPTGGRIRLDGQVVSDPSRGISVPPEQRGVGFVFQNYALWPHMTVRGNVEYPLRRRSKLGRDARRRRVDELLEVVGLERVADKRASDLSGGQQQRVALARALANDSMFMLYDEPLSNLDAQLRARTRTAIRRIHDDLGTTTVFVTHDQEEAFSISDRVVVMNDGVIEQDGSPEFIYERPASAFVAHFVGYDNVIAGARVSAVGPTGAATIVLPGELGGCTAEAVGARVGDPATIAFRARDVIFGRAATESGADCAAGVVRSVSFASGLWSVDLDVGEHHLACRVGSEGGRPQVSVGESVPVAIRPGRPILLPAHATKVAA